MLLCCCLKSYKADVHLQAALVSEVPAEFLEDMAERHPEEPPLPRGCMVFDLFRTWRLDSGSYENIAEVSPSPVIVACCLLSS